MKILELENVTKTFKGEILQSDFTALKDVSFSLSSGKIIGFLGANGAGKTTSIKIIFDFIKPTKGKVSFDESLGRNKNQVFKKLGFLPERPYFYPHLTGRQYCEYMGQLMDMKKSEIRIEVYKWSEKFKIDFALEREIKTYSKGMLQRLGFMASILHRPRLIILDEPLSGVDPMGRKELKDVMRDVVDTGCTIFFSSHIVSDMQEVCEELVYLESGEKKYEGNIEDLIKQKSSGDYLVKYEENNQLFEMVVKKSEKQAFLEKLINKKCNILNLKEVEPTLEEIFYNAR